MVGDHSPAVGRPFGVWSGDLYDDPALDFRGQAAAFFDPPEC